MTKFIFTLSFLISSSAFASYEGTWVGSGGSLKNSRGNEVRCESVRLDVIGDIGSYRVTFEASCGGIHYREKFSDVRGDFDMILRDGWGQIVIFRTARGVHASGQWYDISWPNTIGTVDATLEIDLMR